VIRVKRIYEAASEEDGQRILVDRIWPRGVSKERAAIDLWMKEVGPSTELRRWFAHDEDRWIEFKERYFSELDTRAELVDELRSRAQRESLTLLYSARDEEHNQAVALAEYLERG